MAEFSLSDLEASASNPSYDDPSHVIAKAVTAGDRFRGSAEQQVFAWLLSLAADRDPATAAENLIDHYDNPATKTLSKKPGTSICRVFDLLRQVSAFPQTRLTRFQSGRRRRSQRAARP
jgi:hypothetical protein